MYQTTISVSSIHTDVNCAYNIFCLLQNLDFDGKHTATHQFLGLCVNDNVRQTLRILDWKPSIVLQIKVLRPKQ